MNVESVEDVYSSESDDEDLGKEIPNIRHQHQWGLNSLHSHCRLLSLGVPNDSQACLLFVTAYQSGHLTLELHMVRVHWLLGLGLQKIL
jgi:hypothetical protein